MHPRRKYSSVTMSSSPINTAAAKPYDVAILGASGFTGRYITREALKFLNSPNSPLKTLALAGRNPAKLFKAMSWATGAANPPANVSIVVADASDPVSLASLAAKARIIINCVGPFQIHSQQVVAACIDQRCDYLDICGEPEFMERMELMYHEKAVERGSLVVSSCGFDSIPAEIGLLFHLRQWRSSAAPNRVASYLQSDRKMVGNYPTYEAVVMGYANAGSLANIRKSRNKSPRPKIPGPPPSPHSESVVQRQSHLGLWSVNLPVADASVVRRTLATLTANPGGLPGVNESSDHAARRRSFWSSIKPAYFSTKVGSKSISGLLPFLTLGFFLNKLSRFSIGRWLLLQFPFLFSLGLFSKRRPTEEEIDQGMFSMFFVGEGYGDGRAAARPCTVVVTRVTGPDMGYVTCSMVLIQCALVVLEGRDNLPKGGVYTPGIVFGPSDLQERLEKNGLSFDLITRKVVDV